MGVAVQVLSMREFRAESIRKAQASTVGLRSWLASFDVVCTSLFWSLPALYGTSFTQPAAMQSKKMGAEISVSSGSNKNGDGAQLARSTSGTRSDLLARPRTLTG